MTFPSTKSLQPLLTTQCLGRRLETHDVLDSTNFRAKILATEPATHGMVVIAEQQTAGRGRMTRVWQSPPGVNLYFSMVLHPDALPQTIPQLALIAAIALHQACAEAIPDRAFGLKWPNDVWSDDGKKLSGILCEALFCGNAAAVVVGIGVNVNGTQADFPADVIRTAGTLADLAGRRLDRTRLLAAILNHFEPLYDQWLKAGSLKPFLDYWNRYDILRGNAISVQCGDEVISGTATGIQDNGMLLLDAAGETRTIHAGDTHILKNAMRP